MFRFFRKPERAQCPIHEKNRIWMEKEFRWLIREFGREQIMSRKVLRPVAEDFPIKFDSSENDALALLPIVAKQMEVNPLKIDLGFYDQKLIEFSSDAGRIFSQEAPGESYSAGLFHTKKIDGKYVIKIEAAQLKNTENLVATLAHEIAHVKLFEKGIKDNDESLTDLIPVIFGLGIFNANASFRFYTNSDSWGYQRQGYLSQPEWGHALTMFARIRGERAPEWVKYLSSNVKSDFRKSMRFLVDHEVRV